MGLSRHNCELLLSGRPIHFEVKALSLPNLAMPDIDIVIFGGETEQSMYENLQKLGVLEGVPVINDPSAPGSKVGDQGE